MIDISVVMPVYNGEENLAEAIESILNQTITNFEFIIVCEYETSEESAEIVKQYAQKDSRIIPVFNEKKLGISASLNVGLKMAQGIYVARMDADDISGTRRFEVQKEFMDTYPEIGVCGIMHSVINAPNWLLDYNANPLQINSDLLFFVPLRHPTIMIRNSIIKNYNLYYTEELAGVEDYDFYIRASRLTKLSNIYDKSLFAYRWACNNASIVYKERDKIIKSQLMNSIFKKELQLQFNEEEIEALVINTCFDNTDEQYFINSLNTLNKCLNRIVEQNKLLNVYDESSLINTMVHRWQRAKYNLDLRFKNNIPSKVLELWRSGDYYRAWLE